MEILACRKRISGARVRFEYRVFVPFDQISPERQALISYRSHFGHGRGEDHFARIADVIAPMRHLEMPPGEPRYRAGLDIDKVAERLTALIVRHVFPEFTEPLVPLLADISSDPLDTRLRLAIVELAGSLGRPADAIATIDAHGLGILILSECQP